DVWPSDLSEATGWKAIRARPAILFAKPNLPPKHAWPPAKPAKTRAANRRWNPLACPANSRTALRPTRKNPKSTLLKVTRPVAQPNQAATPAPRPASRYAEIL